MRSCFKMMKQLNSGRMVYLLCNLLVLIHETIFPTLGGEIKKVLKNQSNEMHKYCQLEVQKITHL